MLHRLAQAPWQWLSPLTTVTLPTFLFPLPPGLQGILDDFFQRPICGPQIDGHSWCGDVGLPGPDQGKGGQYLLLPPGFKGDVPEGYFVYRPRTNGVFVFWRGFFKDPKQLEAPVSVLEQTKIYPLGQQASAKPMQFPDASGVPVDMLKPFIDSEYPDPADKEMRGMLSSLGIVKGQPFTPDDRSKKILDEAARTAAKMARVVAIAPPANGAAPKYYPDRQYLNVFPGNADFTSPTFNYIDQRTGFFTFAYSASPGMAVNMVNVGAKYPVAFRDADGNLLTGENSYKLHLPPDIPAAIFWSVNGQPFSCNKIMGLGAVFSRRLCRVLLAIRLREASLTLGNGVTRLRRRTLPDARPQARRAIETIGGSTRLGCRCR